MKRTFWILILTLVMGLAPALVLAQTEPPTPAAQPTSTAEPTPTLAAPPGLPPLDPTPETGIPRVHVIQPGETLLSIAALYGTTVEAIQVTNNITDPSLIFAGQELIIPGAEGQPLAISYTARLGDTLPGVAALFNTTAAEIATTNHLVHPQRLYAGQFLSLVSRTGSAAPGNLTGTPYLVQPGDTLLQVAARFAVSPAELAAANNLSYPARLYPGTRLRIPGDTPYQPLPGSWQRLEARPGPWFQGDTISIFVRPGGTITPTGRLNDQPIRFAPYQDGYIALLGIDAFTTPGLHPLTLEDPAGTTFTQPVQILSSNFPTQSVVLGDEFAPLLAPEVRAQEDAYLATFFEQFTPTPHWEGLFQWPVSTTIVTAGYGGARSYNGGPFDIYHTGIDFAGGTGTPIRAPAAGVVILSQTLDLRGNTIIIDHGLGVMTGYYHLAQSTVQVGDVVTAGQVIGAGGSTGLSTGPHLHWDVRIHNIPVNGELWLREIFP